MCEIKLWNNSSVLFHRVTTSEIEIWLLLPLKEEFWTYFKIISATLINTFENIRELQWASEIFLNNVISHVTTALKTDRIATTMNSTVFANYYSVDSGAGLCVYTCMFCDIFSIEVTQNVEGPPVVLRTTDTYIVTGGSESALFRLQLAKSALKSCKVFRIRR